MTGDPLTLNLSKYKYLQNEPQNSTRHVCIMFQPELIVALRDNAFDSTRHVAAHFRSVLEALQKILT